MQFRLVSLLGPKVGQSTTALKETLLHRHFTSARTDPEFPVLYHSTVLQHPSPNQVRPTLDFAALNSVCHVAQG